MALTLIQAAQQTTDMLLRGVIETVLDESPVLRFLPFETIQGNSRKYTQEVTPGSAAFYAIGDTWTEGTATTQQRTANLAILGYASALHSLEGQIVVFFIIAIAAAEAAVGLAIFVALFRHTETIDVNKINLLKW